MPRYKFTRVEMTTADEIKHVIEAPDDPWFGPLVAFMYLFGCRISEAVILKRRNVWTEERTIVAQIGVLKRREKKGPYVNFPHILHVSLDAPFVRDVLLPYIQSIKDPDSYLFSSSFQGDRHVSRVTVWKHLKEKMKDISPHVLRHDRLMKLSLKGATELQLMDFAGWTDPRPTVNYIRATGRLAAQLAEKVD